MKITQHRWINSHTFFFPTVTTQTSFHAAVLRHNTSKHNTRCVPSYATSKCSWRHWATINIGTFWQIVHFIHFFKKHSYGKYKLVSSPNSCSVNLGTRCECSTTGPGLSTPREKQPPYILTRRLGGPRAVLCVLQKIKNIFPARIRTTIIQSSKS
jgi:hypothetical protein